MTVRISAVVPSSACIRSISLLKPTLPKFIPKRLAGPILNRDGTSTKRALMVKTNALVKVFIIYPFTIAYFL